MNYKYILTAFLISIHMNPIMAKVTKPGFAIVVDKTSYEQAKAEIEAYALSIEKDGLKPVICIDRWYRPDSIRKELVKLYHSKTSPLEGAVFIGDIPVPMIRDAQHMTSAFKMNQDRYEWRRSSVPSDRFYDDFDLTFQFLEQDSARKNYFYYSLLSTSPQRLQPEIYSGRIKPFETPGKYEQLKAYLRKVVRLKQEQNPVNKILYFGGHGYNSESMMARVDEKITLLEQFPWLKGQQNSIGYIDHSMDVHVKPRLLSELQRNDLDIALLHHHGGTDMQYLNGMPEVSGVTQQIDGVKYYLRSKLRSAFERGKDTTETINQMIVSYQVPRNWFNGSFDTAVIRKDSVFNAQLDIHIPDVQATAPNARFIILDACFNGSFHLNEYIAGAYIFNNGNTIAVQANSVNALQDKWANEFMGLLGIGLRIGQWNRMTGYLESHIMGDPSFHFYPQRSSPGMNTMITNRKAPPAYWLKMLASPFPDVRALSLRMLFYNHWNGLSDLLLKTFKASPDGIVRMECLKLLTAYNDDNFLECLTLATEDSYEFIQRQAVYLIGKSGHNRLIPALLKVAMRNNTSERIEFSLKEALSFFPEDKIIPAFEQLFEKEQHFIQKDTVKKQVHQALVYNTTRWADDVGEILDTAANDKKVIAGIRFLRNYNMHPFVEALCKMAKNESNENLKLTLIEALGWFNISYQKPLIIATCKEIAGDAQTPEKIKNEAIKTINRLQTPWYR